MRSIKMLGMFIIPMLISVAAFAQEERTESWLGELDVTVAKLRLEIRLTFDEEGTPSATLISLDQNNAEIKVDTLEIDGANVSMEMNSVGAKFVGELNDEHTECAGTFTQAGQEFPLTFKKVDKVPNRVHVATWAGTLTAGNQEFEFQLRVFDEDGQQTALLDSFSESIMGLTTEFAQEDRDFKFEVPSTAGKYVGKLNDAGTRVDGKWMQAGQEFDLSFSAVDLAETRKPVPRRPQTPKEPFPYDVTELTIENPAADLSLAGTLTTPRGDGPFTTVILVSGSGPQDRDETILQHKPFAVLADHLTRAGIAVFRYDERGVGESTGTYEGSTSEDFASDVEAVFLALRKNDKVQKDRIGIIGHSEGGLIAPMVAVKHPQLSFIVLMAGPGVIGKQILLTQSRVIAADSGAPEEVLELNEKMLRMVLDDVRPGQENQGVVQSAIENFNQALAEDQREKYSLPETAIDQFSQFDTPWFKFFNVYDPAPTLEKVRCKVLSVIGEKDLQVDCEMNQKAIEAALKRGGNEDYKIVRLADLNHLFQKCETGNPSEYSRIEETLNPAFLKVVTEWILRQAE